MVRHVERRIGVGIPHDPPGIDQRHRNRRRLAVRHRDVGGRDEGGPVPRFLSFAREAQPQRLGRPRGEQERADDRRQRGDCDDAAIAAPRVVARRADERQAGGHRDQSCARERQRDRFGDQHERREHGRGPPAPFGVELDQQQAESEGEYDFQIHRRDRRVLQRAARANLRADGGEPGPERRQQTQDGRKLEVLEPCEEAHNGAGDYHRRESDPLVRVGDASRHVQRVRAGDRRQQRRDRHCGHEREPRSGEARAPRGPGGRCDQRERPHAERQQQGRFKGADRLRRQTKQRTRRLERRHERQQHDAREGGIGSHCGRGFPNHVCGYACSGSKKLATRAMRHACCIHRESSRQIRAFERLAYGGRKLIS